MSKMNTLLSRIKPLHHPQPISPSPIPFPPHFKILVKDIIQILSTHPHWQNSLETRFSDCETPVSGIAHFVFDRVRDPELGLKLYEWASKRSDVNDLLDGFSCSSLLKLLARCRVFVEVENLLETMKCKALAPTREALSFVISAYVDSGLVNRALELYHIANDIHNYPPDVIACNALLNALIQQKKVEIARKVYEEMVKRDGCWDNYSVCIMVRGLCKERNVEEGRKLINDRWGKGCIPDIVFYNALVDGYWKRGDVERANSLFKELKMKGFLPTTETYGIMINGFCKNRSFKAVDRLLVEMKERGLDVNVQVYNSIVDAQIKHGSLDAFVSATLVDGFIRHGKLDEAKKLFELTIAKGVDPGVVGYNAMIKGYCKFGMMNDALTCVQRMKDGDHSPDEFTYSTIIDGYVKQNDLRSALKLFGQMVKQKYMPNVVTYTSLINGFFRTGDSSRAEKTFEAMRSSGLKPNVVTYTILIGCFCKEGKISKASSFFELMLLNRCIPNDVTFNYLINGLTNNVATAISNKANESLEIKASLMMDFFRTMISDGWEQRAAAYNSVLICLCHHKMVNVAMQLRDKMTSKGIFPDPVSFAALLYGLCLEGRSNEWKNSISCKLNEREHQIAVNYSEKLNQLLPQGLTSEALKIFHTLLEGVKPHIQENNFIGPASNRS
ncbi:RESPIRATORY COMPLEX I CHAPERONE (CIA84) putative [Salix viminalis]|uniref:RESPIRATORY COMPLEX I CHAPERONE (CIA84) putative n=1 Tax=Salix viminalis TaxID=40686 RepID=A0A9Q0YYG9_SALVM|nr:RESPIRATORY COMPLEX I CHAPERONE (CIA84) putative [Salix viminalis]